MRKKPYTTSEFFTTIMANLKENGQVPDILDYASPTREHYEMLTDEFSIYSKLEYGGNEGIYLDLKFVIETETGREEHSFATIKTLERSREALETMGKLYGDIVYEAHEFVYDNSDDFTWNGYSVLLYKKDKDGAEKPTWKLFSSELEKTIERKDIELEREDITKVVMFDYTKRTETEYVKPAKERGK